MFKAARRELCYFEYIHGFQLKMARSIISMNSLSLCVYIDWFFLSIGYLYLQLQLDASDHRPKREM